MDFADALGGEIEDERDLPTPAPKAAGAESVEREKVALIGPVVDRVYAGFRPGGLRFAKLRVAALPKS